jgi:CheY-like chemotaxis protein
METVLLIENDPATLVAQSLILRSFGYTVLEAADRGEAWRVCHEHHGQVHVVMMNAILDNDSTSEFVTRLQLVCPQIRALLTSDASAELAVMPCEYVLLQNPFRVDALADAVKALLGEPTRKAFTSARL